MTVASDLLLDIAGEKNGYSIGKPWRFTEFSLAAVVPILREVGTQQRGYRLLSEVKDQVRIRDTGHIDKVELINNSPFPVLLKAGQVVGGATQSRALSKSEVLMPEEVLVADCVCVYSTQGIRGGQQVKPVAISPSRVRREVYRGHYGADGRLDAYHYSTAVQNKVWGGVKDYSRWQANYMAGLSAFAASPGARDYGLADIPDTPLEFSAPLQDLAGRVTESEDKFKEVIKNVPETVNQVGVVLLTVSGLDMMESFEHPGSWEAIRKEILKSESGKIADLSDMEAVFEFKEEKARAAIRELLTSRFEEKAVAEKDDTATFMLDTKRFTGEVVTLYGSPIHCTFVRKDS